MDSGRHFKRLASIPLHRETAQIHEMYKSGAKKGEKEGRRLHTGRRRDFLRRSFPSRRDSRAAVKTESSPTDVRGRRRAFLPIWRLAPAMLTSASPSLFQVTHRGAGTLGEPFRFRFLSGEMRRCSLWAFLPILYSVFAAIGLWVVYAIALEHENITPLSGEYRKNNSKWPPYISIAGNAPPASCVFSQVMNLAAFVGFIIGVLRYLQLKHRVRRLWMNLGSAVAFSLACFGMTLVGNFQLTNDEDVHNIGTSLTFGLGTLFCWVQSVLTLEVNLKNEGRSVGVLRFLLSAVITVCVVLYMVLMNLQLHTYAARTQWVLVMCFLTFISTFAVEFRHHCFETVCRDYEALSDQPETFAEVQTEYQTNQL